MSNAYFSFCWIGVPKWKCQKWNYATAMRLLVDFFYSFLPRILCVRVLHISLRLRLCWAFFFFRTSYSVEMVYKIFVRFDQIEIKLLTSVAIVCTLCSSSKHTFTQFVHCFLVFIFVIVCLFSAVSGFRYHAYVKLTSNAVFITVEFLSLILCVFFSLQKKCFIKQSCWCFWTVFFWSDIFYAL